MFTSETTRSESASNSVEKQGKFPSASQLLVLLVIYFVVQIGVRVWISNSVDLDESEQVVLSQAWRWSYGPTLPLYTWIQILFFETFGLSVFSLALLKDIFLASTYIFTYLNARCLTRNHICGAVAAAAMTFIPQIVWESQRDLTHSVLTSALVCATVFCLLKLRERATAGRYAWFGLCVGLGLIAKYNYAVALVGLLLAAISLREFRSVLFKKQILISAAIAAIIIAPNQIWIWHHRDLAFRTATKLQIEEHRQWLAAGSTGLKSLAVSTVTFLGVLTFICAAFLWKRSPARKTDPSEAIKLLPRMLLVIYAVLVICVLAFRVTDIRDRWLQPMLISAPVAAIALWQNRISVTRAKWFLGIAGVIMLGVCVMIPGRILLAERLGRTEPLNKPYDAIARQLQNMFAPGDVIMGDAPVMAGNIRLNLPDRKVITPETAALFANFGPPRAIVWDATPSLKRKYQSVTTLPIPENVREYARKQGWPELDESNAQYFNATFKYHKTRQMKVGVIFLPHVSK